MPAAAAAPSLHCGSAARDGLENPQRLWAIVAISLAVVMSVLDTVMINLAMPTLAHDLHVSPSQSIWAANAYQLAIAMALLPLGKLADTFGHRRIYMSCLAVFTLASLACAASDSLAMLACARFVQGLGAAGIMGVSNALLRYTYPKRLLGRGMGLNGMVVALTLVCGPTVASLVLAVANWHWLFTVNVPIGAVLLVISARALPATRGAGRGFDPLSAVMCALALGSLLLGLDGFAHGEGLALLAAAAVVGAVSTVLLLRRQADHEAPLLPLDLLAYRRFALTVPVMFLAAGAQLMAYVSLPFLFIEAFHRSQLQTGLLFTPWPVLTAVAAPVAGLLSNRIAPSRLCGLGLVIFGVGLTLVAVLPAQPQTIDILWRVALCGLGYGLFQPPNSRALITSIPLERAGAAGSFGATARVTGQAVGAAVVALLLRLAPGDGPILGLAAAAAVAFAGAGVSLLRETPRAAPQPA